MFHFYPHPTANHLLLLVSACVFFLLPIPASAVQELPPDWPSAPAEVDTSGFALVLGGGGARGIAHIGVLEVLEELGMRPSLIVGTSMGAVVGALYASGVSSADLKEIALNPDLLNLVLDAETPRAQLQGGWWGPTPYQLSLLFFHWPPLPDNGFSRGQGFESLVGRETGDALFGAENNFDRLPIPFRCVSTDLLDNSLVIHQRGSLPRAVKASSTIPMIFYPVECEGRYLVDGGFLDNLPVQVARRLGFERAVLVDVSNVHLPDKEYPEDLYQMWVRLAELQTIFPNDYTVGNHDVLLKMPLSSYRSMDMKSGAEILEIGRQTAQQQRSQLLALRDACGPVVNNPPPQPSAIRPVKLKSIRARGLQKMKLGRVLDRLQMHPGDSLELAEAWRRGEWLTQEGSYQTIGFEFHPLGDDSAEVVVVVEEETRPRLELGASLITDDGVAIQARLRRDNLFGCGGSNMVSYRYSSRQSRLTAMLARTINGSGWLSTRASFIWLRELPGLYDYGKEIDTYVFRRTQFSLDLAAHSFQHGWSLYLGGDLGETNSYLESRSAPGAGIRPLRTLHCSLESHSRDLPVSHHSGGARIRFTKSLGADDDEPRWWRTDLGFVLPVNGLGSWEPVLAAGAVGSSAGIPLVHQGRAGGPRGWIGLRRQEIIAPQIAWSRLAVRRTLGAGLYLEAVGSVGWYGGENLSKSRPTWGGGLEIGADSLIGPLRVGYASAENRPGYVYLQAGYEF